MNTLATFAAALVLSLSATAVACEGAAGCSTPSTFTLIAGQHTDAGSVNVWNDRSTIYVGIATANGWELVESHIHIAGDMAAIPQTRSGNPQPGRFANNASHLAGSTTYTTPIFEQANDLTVGSSWVIAVHAVVRRVTVDGLVESTETAWGQGSAFPGKNWAMYLSYQVKPWCRRPFMPDQGLTFKVHNGTESYNKMTVLAIRDSDGVSSIAAGGVYASWCVQRHTFIYLNRVYDAVARLTTDPDLPAHMQNEAYPLLNYLINHPAVGAGRMEKQNALWCLLGEFDYAMLTARGKAMVQDALVNGWDYEPWHNEKVLTIIDVGPSVQRQAIELPACIPSGNG